MTDTYTIFTNNPDVARVFSVVSRYRESAVLPLFEAVRDAVHLGATLVTHPLTGSIKPNESPYKSVVLQVPSSAKAVDFKSLQLIEDAIATVRKLPEKNRQHTERILADFRVIDLDFMHSANKSLQFH